MIPQKLLRTCRYIGHMSDTSDDEGLDGSMGIIRSCIERLSHDSKKLYTNALKVYNAVEHPELDLWSEIFQLHERAYGWAKRHLVGRKASLWQIHQTLLESAKAEKRIRPGNLVLLSKDESEIMDLPQGKEISVWLVLGKLPRFFL
jgi:hypothetical protein